MCFWIVFSYLSPSQTIFYVDETSLRAQQNNIKPTHLLFFIQEMKNFSSASLSRVTFFSSSRISVPFRFKDTMHTEENEKKK